jgi:tight adherence protein B
MTGQRPQRLSPAVVHTLFLRLARHAPSLRRSGRPPPRLDAVAAVVQRLAVLLSAGVTPVSAWAYLDESAPPLAARVARRVAAGESVGDAILGDLEQQGSAHESAWRGLAAAWMVATHAGAPLATSLRGFADSLRALALAQREIEVSLAAPQATARLVMALPVVGVGFGVVLGLDPLRVLFSTVPGLICLVAGVTLMAGARWWNRRLIAAAQPRDLTPGLRCDLMAIAVAGGGALDRAETLVAESLVAAGFGEGLDDAAVRAVLALSRRAGVPAAELLRSEATEARRAASAAAAARASVLAVRLVLPLGVCVLPAFMLLGVAPLLVAVIQSTVAGI